jgi:nucleotide-binding universal stress UspA family protein
MSAEDLHGSVVLCWDGSASATRAIEHASRILGEGRSAIVVFAHVPVEAHAGVLGGTRAPDAPIMGPADAEDLLEEGVRVARAAGFAATGRRVVAESKTAEIIVAAAEEHDAPLIVMGQRGRSGGLKAALLGLGSVAQQVLGMYAGPVLLVGATRSEQ